MEASTVQARAAQKTVIVQILKLEDNIKEDVLQYLSPYYISIMVLI